MFILPCIIGSGTTNRNWRSVRMPSSLFHWGSPLSVYLTTFLKGIFWQFSVWFQVPVKKPLCPRHPAGHAAENVTCEHLFFFFAPLPSSSSPQHHVLMCGGRFLTSAAVMFSSSMRQDLPGTGSEGVRWRISVIFWQPGSAKRSPWPSTHVEMKLSSALHT